MLMIEQQIVPQALLDRKIGHKLGKGEEFETLVGRWRVVALCADGMDTYTVELLYVF